MGSEFDITIEDVQKLVNFTAVRSDQPLLVYSEDEAIYSLFYTSFVNKQTKIEGSYAVTPNILTKMHLLTTSLLLFVHTISLLISLFKGVGST